jgi:hypothetical protein
VHFTYLMGNARVKQNPLGRRGLTRVDMSHDPYISVSFDRSTTRHCYEPFLRLNPN